MNDKNSCKNVEFTKKIVQGLNIDWYSFIDGVNDNMRYETMLNNWINKLYNKKTKIQEALLLINKARRFYYIQASKMNKDN